MNNDLQIGFDWYGTITKYPSIFKAISEFMGKKPFIVSAVRTRDAEKVAKYRHTVENHLAEHGIIYQKLFIVEFVDPKEVPLLKLDICKNNNIGMFFDDRADVVARLKKEGIDAILVQEQKE